MALSDEAIMQELNNIRTAITNGLEGVHKRIDGVHDCITELKVDIAKMKERPCDSHSDEIDELKKNVGGIRSKVGRMYWRTVFVSTAIGAVIGYVLEYVIAHLK